MNSQSSQHVGNRRPLLNSANDTVEVPLSEDGRSALVDRTDFEDLLAAGISDKWCISKVRGKEYVRVRCPYVKGGATTVARLIMRAPAGLVVRYADGDPFNLRRSNLYFAHSSSYWPKGWSADRRRANPRPGLPVDYQQSGVSGDVQ